MKQDLKPTGGLTFNFPYFQYLIFLFAELTPMLRPGGAVMELSIHNRRLFLGCFLAVDVSEQQKQDEEFQAQSVLEKDPREIEPLLEEESVL